MPISAFLQILHKDGTRNGTRFGDDGDRSKQSRGSLTRHISRAPLGKDEYSVSRYKADVDKYIEKYEEYSMGAKNDLDDIDRKLNQAEREVNQVVSDYRRFIMSIR